MTVEVSTTVPGSVWKVLVKAGDPVREGDTVFILELMKSEVPHLAPVTGTVVAVHIEEGDTIDAEAIAIEIETQS